MINLSESAQKGRYDLSRADLKELRGCFPIGGIDLYQDQCVPEEIYCFSAVRFVSGENKIVNLGRVSLKKGLTDAFTVESSDPLLTDCLNRLNLDV